MYYAAQLVKQILWWTWHCAKALALVYEYALFAFPMGVFLQVSLINGAIASYVNVQHSQI